MQLVACGSDKDTTAPPAPRIEPIESPTASATVTIVGSAEPGSSIVMSGGTFTPAEVTADPFTARFSVEVALQPDSQNELSFAAKDKAGNVSEATKVIIQHETGHNQPKQLTLRLFVNGGTTAVNDPISISAGDTLRAETSVQDAAGHTLDRAIAISTNIPSAFVAGPDITNIQAAGKFSLAAVVQGASLATSRNIEVKPGPAAQLSLEVPTTQTTAGTVVHVSAVAKDAYGNVIPSSDITLSSEPSLGATHKPACSSQQYQQGFLDAQRFVAYDVSGAAQSGYVFTLKASSGDLTSSTQLKIEPQAAARFAPRDPADCSKGDLLVFTDASWDKDAMEPLSVATGASVYYRYAVVDAYGNRTTTPVKVVTSSPTGQVVDDGVSGMGQVAHLASAGTYQLSAYVSGVASPATKSFSVNVGSAQTVSVYASSSLVSPGDTVYAFATVKDAFGNVVQCPAGAVDPSTLQLTATPADKASGSTTTCSAGVFQRAFTFSDNATFTLTAAYNLGAQVSGSTFVTVLGLDGTPPTVSIANLRIDGTACTPSGSPPACSVSRGSTVELDLVANDNIALSEVEYSAYFQTTGTLRTRTVLESSNTTLPATVHFSFTVPGNALPEDVPLVGLAIDGSGNRASTSQLVLRVGVFSTFGRNVSVVASGGSINGPTDVAFNAAGDMFIGNDGDQNLLQIAHGSNAPFTFSNYNRNTRYLTVDGSGNIYLTESTRVNRVDMTGASVVSYLNLTGGASEGLTTTAATVAKGTIDATSANDGAIVSVAGQTFELDVSADGCQPSRVCVPLGGASKNQALATAIAAQSSMVGAVLDNTTSKVVLAAKTAGEAGNSLTLTTTGMTVSGATLTQGHEEELFLAQTFDNSIYRIPETLTPTATLASNHGTFNVGTSQRGVAIKDMTLATTSALRDLYLYFIDNQNTDTVKAYHAVDNTAPASVFALSSGGGQSFNALYDVVLEPTSPVPATNPKNGCLLVSDQGQGKIYAIDTRNPALTTPTVTLIASGLSAPSGMAFYNGDLYVADRTLDAIFRFSPSSDTTDCF